MANIVSTKFGDRGLVHLPPVNLTGKATPQVQTIAPAFRDYRAQSAGARYGGSTSVIPKEYAYVPPVGRDSKNPWLGHPEKGYAQGNIVVPESSENGIGNQMFSQLLQQSNVQGYQNYNQGYPVVPPVIPPVSSSTTCMHCTQPNACNIAPAQQLSQQQGNMTQKFQALNRQQYPQGQQAPVQQQQTPTNQQPQDKHIFYGPNGEILPGPPAGFFPGGRAPYPYPTIIHDFDVEAHLHFGNLKAVKMLDPMQKFPVFPEYLMRDLKHKYGHYERTLVRIIARDGEIHVHATPAIPGSQILAAPYVPVYIDEDEYYRKYPQGPSPSGRIYGTPPLRINDRLSLPPPPSADDPIDELRWRKDDTASERIEVRPIERTGVRR